MFAAVFLAFLLLIVWVFWDNTTLFWMQPDQDPIASSSQASIIHSDFNLVPLGDLFKTSNFIQKSGLIANNKPFPQPYYGRFTSGFH